MITRRAALRKILNGAAGLALHQGGWSSVAEASTPIDLRLGAEAPVEIAEEFVGLGYEMSSVAPMGLLSAKNRSYVALVNGLGARGVIRAGGIVADYTRFDPHGTIATDPHNTVLTEASLQQFSSFLHEIGWKAIWSLNFAQGSLQDAVIEATAVHRALGPHLLAFELGNEVENYGRGRHPFRPPSWDYASYRSQYRQWHDVIRKALPGTQFAAPDTASSVDWVTKMAEDADGTVQLLTTHYYRANQSQGSAEQLLMPDPRLQDVLSRLRSASRQSGIPWRICEINSFSGGGLPGVSDTMIGALWTLDTMLLLAAYGCSGVNMETGVNQLGFLSSYSPIRNDSHGTATAGIPYYGMLAFAEARKGCNQMLPIDLNTRGMNAAAYVLGRAGKARSVVILNREGSRDALVSMRDLRLGDLTALRLTASSDEHKVTFGGSAVDTDGHWSATAPEKIRDGLVRVPARSAVVARAAQPR